MFRTIVICCVVATLVLSSALGADAALGECTRLSHDACAGRCHWCAAQRVCANPLNDHTGAADPASCDCGYFGQDSSCYGACQSCADAGIPVCVSAAATCGCHLITDEAICLAQHEAYCAWFDAVLDSPTQKNFCATQTEATTGCPPITCEGIRGSGPCGAAGCTWADSLCQSSTCFTFFLPRFVSQPYLLFALGVLKDVGVLLLIGAVGDNLARAIAKRTHPAKQWYHGRTTPLRLDETVYISDDACRDGDGDGAASERFDEYCGRVARALFDVTVTVDERHRAALLDAVAFALFDESCWIGLDPATTPGPPLLATGESSVSPRAEPARNETQKLLATTPVQLVDSDFASAVALQEKVTAAVLERATSVVFYTQSRDIWVSVASAVNTFPSVLQLVYYVAGVATLFASTTFLVVGDAENLHQVEQIAAFKCNASSTTNSTGSETVLAALSSHLVRQAVYFLIGFRLVNASTFATAVLVFVKLARGLYQRHCGLHLLTLSQRLPIMSVASSRAVQAMLFVYVLLVAPFALCGATYGWGLSVVCGAPVIVGAALVAIDAAVLWFFRRMSVASSSAVAADDMLDGRSFESRAELGSAASAINAGDGDGVAATDSIDDEPTLARFFDVDRRRAEQAAAAAAAAAETPPPVTSMASAAPTTLPRALLVFLLTEELPMIFIALSLQAAFNYTARSQYAAAFGLSNAFYHPYGDVVSLDFNARSTSCVAELLRGDVSAILSTLSSLLPFL